MQGRDCSILHGFKAMIALRSEIKMPLTASCLYIFKYWPVKKVFAFFKFVGIE